MFMVSDRSLPLNDTSDKAENQDLRYYNVISHELLGFSFLCRCTQSYMVSKVMLDNLESLKNELSLMRIQYKALSTAL